jgi:hypothetical protein
MTLYVSHLDKALSTSSLIYDEARAGYSPPVLVVENVDTVDVSEIDLDLLGHGYFSGAFAVLNDIYSVLRESAPGSRIAIDSALTPMGEAYWRLRG